MTLIALDLNRSESLQACSSNNEISNLYVLACWNKGLKTCIAQSDKVVPFCMESASR